MTSRVIAPFVLLLAPLEGAGAVELGAEEPELFAAGRVEVTTGAVEEGVKVAVPSSTVM